MPSALITGASRGLGLEFVRQLESAGWSVHACARQLDRAHDLKDMGDAIYRHRLDVTDSLQIAGLGRELAGQTLDLVVNNAGIFGDRSGFGETNYESWIQTLEGNTLAPMRIAEGFVDHMARAKPGKLVNISSILGSIANNTSGGNYAYRSSKAALNMVTKGLSVDLEPRNIIVVSVHPGWVQTDMGNFGGRTADVTPAESVRALLKLIAELGPEHSGCFLQRDGTPIEW